MRAGRLGENPQKRKKGGGGFGERGILISQKKQSMR